MRVLFSCLLLMVATQALQAQITIYAGQGLSRQKVGIYENEVIFGIDKNEQITSRGTIGKIINGKIEIWAPDHSPVGFVEWNDDLSGASTIYNNQGKKLGFVSFLNGAPCVYSLKTGMPALIGTAQIGSQPLNASAYPSAAAAAAFLLLFDWC